MDPISAQAYAQPLAEKMRDRVERLKQQRHRATLVKRPYIPTGNGQLRPLGSPAVEEKRLQGAVPRLLQALHEPDCLRGRDG